MSILAAFPTAVNFEIATANIAPEADGFRPTAGPDYIPTAEEEAEAAELLNGDDFPAYGDDDLEEMALASYAMDRISSGVPWL